MEKLRYILGTICLLCGVFLLFECEWAGSIAAFGVGGAILAGVIYF